jgi:hypothetical protein
MGDKAETAPAPLGQSKQGNVDQWLAGTVVEAKELLLAQVEGSRPGRRDAPGACCRAFCSRTGRRHPPVPGNFAPFAFFCRDCWEPRDIAYQQA